MSCSGCSACALVCPKNCITIKRDDEGFFRAFKEEVQCSHCGLCENVCPFITMDMQKLDEGRLYSAYAKDNSVRKTASSGGVASCLAEYGMEQGYSICGVVLNYETMKAEHRIIKNKQELNALRGSKYLQSDCFKAFRNVMEELGQNSSSKFMVFGTPCQIAGLKNVLTIRNWQNRVILVDIFCHGVPSNFLWEKYKNWIVKKMNLKSIHDVKNLIFRNKYYSWHSYYMNIVAGGGENCVCS